MNDREILITNDDGIAAKGIHLLAGMMRRYGNVTVVAPLHPQSGKSSAISLETDLFLEKIGEEPGLRQFTFSGTPVDCVKMAMNECYPADRRPDLVMSGINHGSNCSVAALYSGTLGACMEGTLYSVPSIGFSITSHSPDPDFSGILKYGGSIIEKLLETGIAPDTYINVNFPDIPADEIRGIRAGHQGKGLWVEEIDTVDRPETGKCYRLGGHFRDTEDQRENADHCLVENGYIAVVPVRIDHTDYSELERLQKEWRF